MNDMNLVEEFIKKTSVEEFAGYIDHTIIKPEATTSNVLKGVEEYKKYGFACLVLSPYHSLQVLSKNTDIKVCTVIGFPMGYHPTEVKLQEAKMVLERGAKEIDMVMNIQAFKSGDYDYVLNDIKAMVELAHSYNALVKVIIETGLLSDDEKVRAAGLVVRAGADYVKTCTGFLGGKATIHDVVLLKKTVGEKAGVKAAGGIRHAYDAVALILAGASRIGTSSGVKIIEEYKNLKEKL